MNINDEQLKRDINFLLSFLPATEEDQVEPGLSPFFYITNSYEGDLEIARTISEIKTRYGINSDEREEIDSGEDDRYE